MRKTVILLIALYFCLIPNAYAFDTDQIEIHGFISQGYLKSDKNDFYFAETGDGTFQFNEMGINFSSALTDQLRAGIQFLSRDLGEIGNNKIEIDWAYGDYRYRNWLGIRAGKIKRPYGLYNRSRDIDAARTFVMLPPMVYDDVPRESYTATTGIGIYGYLPFGFSYECQYGATQMDAEGGTAHNVEKFMNTQIHEIEGGDTFTAYLEWKTPVEGLILAGTVFSGPDYTMETSMGKLEQDAQIYVVSLEYAYENLTFAAEHRTNEFEFILNDTVTLADQTAEMWYVSASYEFTDWFTLGSYYGELYGNKDDKEGNSYKNRGLPAARAWRKDLALTTRFDISENWIFKLEGHLMDGLTQVTTPLNEADENWFLFAAKMTFSF